jgi:Domain of unknown function (DUF4440)
MLTRRGVRRSVALGFAAALAVLASACDDSSGSGDGSESDSSSSTAPMQVGDGELISEFFELVQAEDLEGLEEYLSPAFQLQRADGSHATKDEYLENPAVIEDFEIVDVEGTRVGDVRVIRSTFIAIETINGRPVSTEAAPRLSTFVWNGERWQIVSHANFVPIEG